MNLSSNELSAIVEKYPPIERFTIGEDEDHIIFHLTENKEIAVSIHENQQGNNEKFEGLGQLRNRNQRGFGEGNCVLKENTKLELVTAILDNLLGHNLQRKNR